MFVLDTNVLLSDVNALESFEDNDVVLPLAVLEELDDNKKRMDDVGRNARAACRALDAVRAKGSLRDGVKLPRGGRLFVSAVRSVDLPSELCTDKNDNLVIALALQLKSEGKHPIVVSKDINVRVKCDAVGLVAQDYYKQRAASAADELYTGTLVERTSDVVIAELYENGKIHFSRIGVDTKPNQFVTLANEHGTPVHVRRIGEWYQLVRDHKHVFGLMPRNVEQMFALDLLLDDRVKLVSLVGQAGCGKTLISLAAGLHLTLSKQSYDKLVVTRPIEPLGRDIGYLPGTMEEKMAPWIAPIKDNLEFLFSKKGKEKDGKRASEKSEKDFQKRDPYIDLLFEEKKIEIEAVTYIRGRSIPNSYIIIDEAQNLTIHQLKTIITRSGDGTKIVLSGDVQQIDVLHMDEVSNGLSYVVEKFKDHPIAGHVTMRKGERSDLATIAAKIL